MKFYTNILILKSTFYRIISIAVFTLVFGFKVAALSGIGAFILYYTYDCIFSKIFKIRAENKGFTILFTGLPCAGKTTLADELHNILQKKEIKSERLDGDIVRKEGLSNDLKFSKEDRNKNIKRIIFVSKVLSRNGVVVLSSFVSPYKKVRNEFRKEVTNFVEIYVKCSPTECANRDVKGMWKKAKEGMIKGFTGWNAPYEQPNNPEIVVNTEKCSITECVKQIIKYLKKEKLI